MFGGFPSDLFQQCTVTMVVGNYARSTHDINISHTLGELKRLFEPCLPAYFPKDVELFIYEPGKFDISEVSRIWTKKDIRYADSLPLYKLDTGGRFEHPDNQQLVVMVIPRAILEHPRFSIDHLNIFHSPDSSDAVWIPIDLTLFTSNAVPRHSKLITTWIKGESFTDCVRVSLSIFARELKQYVIQHLNTKLQKEDISLKVSLSLPLEGFNDDEDGILLYDEVNDTIDNDKRLYEFTSADTLNAADALNCGYTLSIKVYHRDTYDYFDKIDELEEEEETRLQDNFLNSPSPNDDLKDIPTSSNDMSFISSVIYHIKGLNKQTKETNSSELSTNECILVDDGVGEPYILVNNTAREKLNNISPLGDLIIDKEIANHNNDLNIFNNINNLDGGQGINNMNNGRPLNWNFNGAANNNNLEDHGNNFRPAGILMYIVSSIRHIFTTRFVMRIGVLLWLLVKYFFFYMLILGGVVTKYPVLILSAYCYFVATRTEVTDRIRLIIDNDVAPSRQPLFRSILNKWLQLNQYIVDAYLTIEYRLYRFAIGNNRPGLIDSSDDTGFEPTRFSNQVLNVLMITFQDLLVLILTINPFSFQVFERAVATKAINALQAEASNLLDAQDEDEAANAEVEEL